MPRRVTYEVGVVGHDAYVKDVPGARQEITVEIHDDDAQPWSVDTKLEYVGTDIPRVDGPAKATGAAKYSSDIQPASTRFAYAGLVVSPHAHAVVKKVEAAAAREMKGVLGVKTFPDKRVTHAGTIVAAVCAESKAILADALHAIQVTYEVLPAAVTTEDAMKSDAPRVDPRGEGNLPPAAREGERARGQVVRGDVDKAFDGSNPAVEAEYRTAIQTHSCLEPHGCTISIHDETGAQVYASTQATAGFATGGLVRATGLPANRVRVDTQHMGGGFGSKFGAMEWDVLCAEFARETKHAVQLFLTRRQEHLIGGNRPDSIQKLALAGTKDGHILGLKGETFGTSGNGSGGAGAANFSVYNLPALSMLQQGVQTFSARGCAFRAPRHPQGVFAFEGILELYARKIRMDPLEVRRLNDPHPVRQVQWRIGAERIDWEKNRRRVPGSDREVVKRGLGCAAALWGQAGRGEWRVRIGLHSDGQVDLENCVQDLGTGIRTVMAILAAEELGIPPAHVQVHIGDSRLPSGPGSGGSTTTPSIGPAVRDAALRARESLAGLVALEWGVEESAITWRDGAFHGPGDKSVPLLRACGLIGKEGLWAEGQRRRNWSSPFPSTAGCQFAQVAVDTETGVIHVEKVVAVHDAGRIVDTLTARSQVNGGVIQGISYALYEERRLDRNLGDMVNPTLDTYRILGMQDCPEIDCVFTSVVSGYNNAGLMGLGEPATVPTAAAVANAVFNATGVQVRELPMTPARVLAALERGPQ